MLVFFIGSIIIRGAGCIINDLFDRNLDKLVERTKNRPIASGAVSIKEAIILLLLLLFLGFLILLSLNITSITIGVIAIFFIVLYPLMKRVTYFPQAFLGITINLGVLIGYASIKNDISYDAVILYIACGFWTLGYDTIYAFMDIKDDKKVGIKSTAIFFEQKPYKLYLAAFYTIFLILFAFSIRESLSTLSIIVIIICLIYSLWIVFSLDVNDTENCLIRFKANNYIGFILFLAMLLERL